MAMDAFLFIKGVPGEATATVVKPAGLSDNAIEIFSFSFGASNPSTIGTQGGGGGGGKVSLSSMNIMKRYDKASPLLFQACCTGDHFDKAALVLRKAGGTSNKQGNYLVYDFEEVFVDSVQQSASSGGDDYPTESVSFSFGKVTITYFAQDAKGALAKAGSSMWDVRTASAA